MLSNINWDYPSFLAGSHPHMYAHIYICTVHIHSHMAAHTHTHMSKHTPLHRQILSCLHWVASHFFSLSTEHKVFCHTKMCSYDMIEVLRVVIMRNSSVYQLAFICLCLKVVKLIIMHRQEMKIQLNTENVLFYWMCNEVSSFLISSLPYSALQIFSKVL